MATKGPTASAQKVPPTARMASRKKWDVGGRECVQAELTFAAKTEFLGLLTEAMDAALDAGLDLRTLVGLDQLRQEDLTDMNAQKFFELVARSGSDMPIMEFVRQFGKVVFRVFGKVPKLLPEAYCIILAIPEEDRPEFKAVNFRAMDDDTGFGIFSLFVEQNARLLVDFARRWWETFAGLQSSTSST